MTELSLDEAFRQRRVFCAECDRIIERYCDHEPQSWSIVVPNAKRDEAAQ